MSTKLYVGNLDAGTSADELREAFGKFGSVSGAKLVIDRATRRSRGYAFVEMADGADRAIEGLNGAEFRGRTLAVSEARPHLDRSGFGAG